jgi:cytochrome oxidase Cu insertion factor (SCO1/SenC/PrrC family)
MSEVTEPIWQDYQVYRAKVERRRQLSGDHSARTYVIDKNGNLRLTYLFGTGSDVIAEDIAHLLRKLRMTGKI